MPLLSFKKKNPGLLDSTLCDNAAPVKPVKSHRKESRGGTWYVRGDIEQGDVHRGTQPHFK